MHRKGFTSPGEELEKRNGEIKNRFIEFFPCLSASISVGGEAGPTLAPTTAGRPPPPPRGHFGRVSSFSILALVLLMALPLGWLAALSVGSEAGPTLAHYRRVFADPALQKALWNTVVLAFWVGLASLAVGAPLTWLTARTNVPAC